eukprot:COSAG04_NODE_746_length_10633_cov_8.922456_4_plen_62_part_00
MPPAAGKKLVTLSLLDLPMNPKHWRLLVCFAVLSGFLAGSLLRQLRPTPPNTSSTEQRPAA